MTEALCRARYSLCLCMQRAVCTTGCLQPLDSLNMFPCVRGRLRDQVERLLANDRALALIVAMESALDDDRLEARAVPSVPDLKT